MAAFGLVNMASSLDSCIEREAKQETKSESDEKNCKVAISAWNREKKESGESEGQKGKYKGPLTVNEEA